MKWFMSYAFTYRAAYGADAILRFGSNCQTRDEHPVATIARWAQQWPERRFVLLSFQQVPADTPDYDAET